MSQTSLLESQKRATEYQLNYRLEAVLGSLDVQLEEELTRYRRYRRRSQPQTLLTNKKSDRPLDQNLEMMSMGKISDRDPEQILSESKPTAVSALASEFQKPTSPGDSADSAIESNIAQALQETNTLQTEETAAGQKSASITESPKALNDYLESSERLLKSLEQPTTPKQKQPNLIASLFTPLGIFSMLVFLISCAMLGYTVNPTGSNVLWSRWFGREAITAEEQTSNEQKLETADTGNSRETALLKSPDLTSQEFVELDLSTLSNINPNPSPIPSIQQKPTIPPPISGTITPPLGTTPAGSGGLNNLGTTLLPQTVQPSGEQVNPIRRSSPVPPAPKPAPKPSAPPVVQTPIQSGDGWYYVVINYTGENSLTMARQAIPDAYIRQGEDGTKIQMGALLDAESAKRFLTELQQKGISPQYYKF